MQTRWCKTEAGRNEIQQRTRKLPAGLRSILLLVCHAPGAILPTIRSRCRLMGFAALDEGQVAEAGAAALRRMGRPFDEAAIARAARLADGALDSSHPGLADHLWATTLAKLAVDQPAYDTYQRHAAPTPTDTP